MTRYTNYITVFLLAVASLVACHSTAEGADRPITVQAQVDREKVTMGESLLLQIKIDGDDSPAEPDLSGLEDFTVEPRGGGRNNRESISIINGRMSRVSEHGYVFRYALTPERQGMLTIPPIEITAAGKTLLTQPIPINVVAPIVTDEFKLRLSLSETEGFVGQPLVLTLKWYVNRNIAEFRFELPFLEDERFTFADYPADSDYQGQDAIPVELPGGRVIARKGQEGQYATVTLRRIIIPKDSGTFTLGPGTAYSKIITGYRQNRSGRPLDDLFNNNLFKDMFGRSRPVYQQLVTKSNELQFTVLPLPRENRPPEFTGLVGQYSIAAEASPTEINVGDPITLTIMVTGSEYMDNVVLPSLDEQPEFHDNFKVPDEAAPGETAGRVKEFVRTIRARHAAVTEIPPISLYYFNPENGRYEKASSRTIPLQVRATTIVTANDAEGAGPEVMNRELTSLDKGIAHNYVGEKVLQDQGGTMDTRLGFSAGLLLILLPPGFYLLVLVPVYFKRRRLQDADTLQARAALPGFTKELADIRRDAAGLDPRQIISRLLEAMREYLRKRLRMPPGGLVYEDVAVRLQQLGVDATLQAELQELFDSCEAYRYGAMSGNSWEDIDAILDRAAELVAALEQDLKNI